MAQQAQIDDFKKITPSDYQRNFDHIFSNITIFGCGEEEDYFEWLESLKLSSLHIDQDIQKEPLGTGEGGVRDYSMGMSMNQPWSALREEPKRCISDLTLLGHSAAQLENTAQNLKVTVYLYINRYAKMHFAATNNNENIQTLQGHLDS